MSEGVALRERWRSGRVAEPKRRVPATELEFPGCEAVPMTVAEYEAYDGRVEFYDSASGLAWMACESPGPGHEFPRTKLDRLMDRIGQARSSPINCYGSSDLRFLDAETGRMLSVHPDQIVFLSHDFEDPQTLQFFSVGRGPYPDVVLEVDHTTDVRGSRLARYEEWRFPEVWVEVPDADSPSRPRGRKPGLEIYPLEGERFVRSPVSRAFPGWQATEIHRALNERFVSAETGEVLKRVGRTLREREGGASEEDPWVAGFIDEGRAEGRIEERAEMVRELLRSHGIELPANFPEDLGPRDRAALCGASPGTVITAAAAAGSLADFLARLRDPDA